MILGTYVAGKSPRTNYLQTDPEKGDYLLGREVIANHFASEENPHNVTAAQVGAAPASHVSNTNNPHGVTAEQLGAASASPAVNGSAIAVNDSAVAPLEHLVIYGKTTQDGTPNPEAPVELVSAGASGEINTVVAGKNLLHDSPEVKDGYIQWVYDPPLPAGTYTLSGIVNSNDTDDSACLVTFIQQSGPNVYEVFKRLTTRQSVVITTSLPTSMVRINASSNISNSAGDTLTAEQMQLEIGSTATDFEPYKEPQTLTASTVGGLPGNPLGATIPDVFKANETLMAGVWWNEEEQQYYISDTIDFARGVRVQRTLEVVYDGSDDEAWGRADASGGNYIAPEAAAVPGAGGLCDQYSYAASGDKRFFIGKAINFYDSGVTSLAAWKEHLAAAPITVIYPLDTPIETALSAEELAQYAALRTKNPNTTIYNDAGADMDVGYYTPNSALGASHAANSNNPHSVTCAQVGAAPTGYGLGEFAATAPSDNDANNATRNGKYNCFASTANGPGVDGVMEVSVRTFNYAHQMVIEDGTGCTAHRRQTGGVWGEWEWVNPPMVFGKEYRTTERWKGKPVYTKSFSFGTLPNNASAHAEWSPDSGYAEEVIDVSIIANTGALLVEKCSVNQGGMWITIESDYSNYTATVVVKYTKA